METEGILLNLGQSIVSPNDPLKQITVNELYQRVTKPDSALQSTIQQLRTVLSIEPKRYQAIKRMLPYVTCGSFNPPYRRTENFSSISSFIIDIDHLGGKGIDIGELRARLIKDNSIHLMFASPSNDGLKLLFFLSEKCFDHAKYSMFYKLFVTRFAAMHNLGLVVDKCTSDVTRACFLSIDEEAWFNPFAVAVEMKQYVDFDNSVIVDAAQAEIKEAEAKQKELNTQTPSLVQNDLPPDILQQIKEKLNPNIKAKCEKQLVVPEELNEAEQVVKERMSELGILVKQVDPINYGKKFVFELALRKAQLNLFYGKRGYVIVKQPISGADAELTDVVHQIMCEIFVPQ